MICGRKAIERLESLAARARSHADIAQQVSLQSVRKPLAEILVRRFLKERQTVDIRHVDRALAEAGRVAASKRLTLTHFVPCHLMIAQNPSTFTIGPIRFHSRSSFRSLLAQHVQANRIQGIRRDRKVLSDMVRYYKTFGWVAEVTIPECDKQTSDDLAKTAVIAALDCLHLLLGPGHTRKMIVGGPAINRDKRGRFSITATGELNLMASYGGPGEVAFEDDWFTLFDRPDYGEVMKLCGVALEAAADPTLDRPLSDRFLEAALWFGEAVRESSLAAKVVKYVTALERIMMTDEKDDITSVISERVAALCFDPRTIESREQWLRKAQRAYTLRSKLVHGSMSPKSPAVSEGVRLGAEVGQQAILSTLLAFGETALRSEGVSSRELARWFHGVIAHADRLVSGGEAALKR